MPTGFFSSLLVGNPSPEAKKRIEELLTKLEQPWPNMPLQTWRAITVLERIGSAEAKGLLEKLAKGNVDARLTQEAKASLERLAKAKVAAPKE